MSRSRPNKFSDADQESRKMTTDKPIILKRDCPAVMVPSGEPLALKSGGQVWLTQALGGGYTVMTDHGYTVRIDGRDGDALGLGIGEPAIDPTRENAGSVQEQVWQQLRCCFDPEIPVNIVDLGLVYDCGIEALPNGGHKVVVHFTLTAQGCGMGEILKADIRRKLLEVRDVREAAVELVWDPPWSQSRMSVEAKHQLGIE
jgi:probable FeS assembly SUF system protein SufT